MAPIFAAVVWNSVVRQSSSIAGAISRRRRTGRLRLEMVDNTTRAPRLCEAKETLAACRKLALINSAAMLPAWLATSASPG